MKFPENPALGIPIIPQEYFDSIKNKAVLVKESADIDIETGIYRSSLSPKELLLDFPKIKTFYELFNNSVKYFGKNKCLGWRVASNSSDGVVHSKEYFWKTYEEVNADRLAFGAGLMSIYDKHVVEKAAEWFLGIFALNRYEWLVSDLGAGCYGVPVVSLYDTLGPETSEYIINHSQLPIIVTSIDKVAALLQLGAKCPILKVIIVMDDPMSAAIMPVLKKWGDQVGVIVISFKTVCNIGKKNPRSHKPPSPSDTFIISYTSGTTGNPKGAVISHQNMISALRGANTVIIMYPTDVHVSYLPLAHIFERILISNVLLVGASAGFFRGDVALLIEDLGVLQPTCFPSVPRLFNRIYDKIIAGAMGGSKIKAALFTKALQAKLYHLRNGGHLTHSVWDPLIFNKVKAVLGGKVRFMITGSAPISANVLEFLRVATGAQVVEGYGQTETCAALSVSWQNDFQPGHVGSVTPNLELKLVSVPEMNYHAKDLKGEIWVRGPGVFKGYLKEPKKTAEAITPDGWLLTGDIGTLDGLGRLSIVDRKKNIFKLAQGEYVAPEKLEGSFLKSSFVAQIYVHGDSLQSELVGVVVPDQEFSIKWALANGILPSDTVVPPPPVPNAPLDPLVATIAASPKFQKAVLKDLAAVGKRERLRGFEFIKAIYVYPQLFTTESGLLTPTFKLKRPEAAKVFRPQIDVMYKDLNEAAPKSKL